ncbi:MAG: DUF5110 domain-containing protein [Spirochaetales bacterium]|nr:DUF5110 domain-containing protein [Spirochaetales bacterium]
MKNHIILFFIIVITVTFSGQFLYPEIKEKTFLAADLVLHIHVLDDDLIHCEYYTKDNEPGNYDPFYTSPMIDNKDYNGPAAYKDNSHSLETKEIKLEIDETNLGVKFFDKKKNKYLTSIVMADYKNTYKRMDIDPGNIRDTYGLGQQFKILGSTEGDWIDHKVRTSGEFGNVFESFGSIAGMEGNVQMPVLYATGDDGSNYVLFLDNIYKQNWDFSTFWWRVNMYGDQVRFYFMTGEDFPDLRKDYMELVGNPPVPPKKAFGLWVSEFGYKNWDQIDTILRGLRKDNFPIDGFVLDLFWFGGILGKKPESPMGRLDWDINNEDGNDYYFPGTKEKIKSYSLDNIGIAAIEESYICEDTDTYEDVQDYLVKSKGDPEKPALLTEWFGKGGMLDWSDMEGAAWIHNNKRYENLIKKGVTVHWTDLGEPEKYDKEGIYDGIEETKHGKKNKHADIHNIYNLLWNKSIYEGYYNKRKEINTRSFILTRSGASGIHRFGTAMWSGDIGSNLKLLATHLNCQMHMSFSGVDYYGADIGGFRREGVEGSNDEERKKYENVMYTQWFANGCWFDTPVRPHTDNTFQTSKKYNTAPNLVGDVKSNLYNLRQRYELIPYYYSLAYRAYLFSEPVIPPLVFYYQNDKNVRDMGHEKLIGKDILVAIVADINEKQRNVYLPAGTWINYHTNQRYTSAGAFINDIPVYGKDKNNDNIFRLPVFVRAGAILPLMYVDEYTKDVFGNRTDESLHNELILKVYESKENNKKDTFTLYEDDGITLHYDKNKKPLYKYRTTLVSQKKNKNRIDVTIDKTRGKYPGEITRRDNIVILFTDKRTPSKVKINSFWIFSSSLDHLGSKSEFMDSKKPSYYVDGDVVYAKSGVKPVKNVKKFSFFFEE